MAKAKLPPYDVKTTIRDGAYRGYTQEDAIRAYLGSACGQQDGWRLRTRFENSMTAALLALAEKHPKELEEIIIENFFTRAVHEMRRGAKVDSDDNRFGV